jgi:hypothetical protein
MWVIALKLSAATFVALAPLRQAYPSAQACTDAVKLLPNSRAWAVRHGGDLVCVRYEIVGERRA